MAYLELKKLKMLLALCSLNGQELVQSNTNKLGINQNIDSINIEKTNEYLIEF